MSALVLRELGWRPPAARLCCRLLFFLLVATLFPFAVGPDGALLARTGGGALWMAALLAALLPVDRLVAPDRAVGRARPARAQGYSEESVALAKLAGHWLSFGPLLDARRAPRGGADEAAGGSPGPPRARPLDRDARPRRARPRRRRLDRGPPPRGALAGLLLLPLAVPLLDLRRRLSRARQRERRACSGSARSRCCSSPARRSWRARQSGLAATSGSSARRSRSAAAGRGLPRGRPSRRIRPCRRARRAPGCSSSPIASADIRTA